jgi:DNA-binding transcriptional LysR family regulator
MQVRGLDVDDLFLIFYFGSGMSLIQSARKLNLSSPAITHRFHKIEQCFGVKVINRDGRSRTLTPDGVKIYEAIIVIVNTLQELEVQLKVAQ